MKIQEILSRSLGRCFEIDLGQFDEGVRSVEIVTNLQAYVYINLPGQFNNDDSKSKVEIKMNKKLFIEVTYEVLKMNFENDCRKYKDDFTYDFCTFHFMDTIMKKRVGCTVPYHTSDLTVCKSRNESIQVVSIY